MGVSQEGLQQRRPVGLVSELIVWPEALGISRQVSSDFLSPGLLFRHLKALFGADLLLSSRT